jgi:hypothetical protein
VEDPLNSFPFVINKNATEKVVPNSALHFPGQKTKPSSPLQTQPKSQVISNPPVVEKRGGIPLFRIPTSALVAQIGTPLVDTSSSDNKALPFATRNSGGSVASRNLNEKNVVQLPSSVNVKNGDDVSEREKEKGGDAVQKRGKLTKYLISWRDAMVRAQGKLWKSEKEKTGNAKGNVDKSFLKLQKQQEKSRKRQEKEEAMWREREANARETEREIKLIREELKGTVFLSFVILFYFRFVPFQ